MPRRKKTEESEDEDPEENGAPTTTMPSTPQGVPGISPPGMKLRSGRKKRRRGASDEDSIMTTDDDEVEKPPAKRRATKSRKTRANATKHKSDDDDDDNDDESMTDASVDDDESMEDAKPKGQNGYKPHPVVALPPVQETEEAQEETSPQDTAVASEAAVAPTNGGAKPAARLAPISKLRMPSKHTPGKLETTAPAPGRVEESRRLQFGAPTSILNQVPPAAPAAAASTTPSATATETTTSATRQQQEKPVESPEGIANAELIAILAEGEAEQPQVPQVSLTARWYQVATMSLVTTWYSVQEVAVSLVVPQTEQYAQGEEEDFEVPLPSPLLTRPHVWFVLWLLLQVVCWNPIVTTVGETSDRSLAFYNSIFGKSTLVEEVVMEKPVAAISDTISEEKWKELETLSQLLESFDQGFNVESEMKFVEKEILQIRGRLRERQQALQDWKDGLDDVESALQGLASAEFMDDVPRLFFRANEILGFFKDMVPPDLSTEILDTTYVFLWETSSTGTCTQTTDDSSDPLLTPEKLQMAKDELRQMSLTSTSEIMSNDGSVKALQSWIREALPTNATSPSKKEESVPTNGLTQDMVGAVIANFLEKQRADQLGVVDYASRLAGASVIRVGKRATSPSLVDSLPLLNRLLKHAGLRFYGYGPEAALTPTFPLNALGQCWAFESNPKQEGGRYATLTVELGKPIYVSSVVVEHAPKELTDQLQTAIRDFRILGYKDSDAASEPWHLGSFKYDIGKSSVPTCLHSKALWV